MAATSSKAVFLALVGNGILTVIKFIAFGVSGSGAMFSESIHSFADAGNQGLLYLGIRRSDRPADEMFPYGYGPERFLFALLSAVGIFVLGCGVTVYHGVHTLLHPPDLQVGWLTWAVLVVSFLVDGAVLLTAIRTVAVQKGEKGFWQFVKTSSDPTVLAVLFEDSVACLGVLVAATGILLTQLTGSAVFDAISSILIGLLLGAVAVWLGYRNRTLILGPAIPREVQREVRGYLEAQESVQNVLEMKSRLVGADRFRVAAQIDWDGRVLARGQLDWVRQALPERGDDAGVAAFTEEFGGRLLDALAVEIDRIEVELVRLNPRLAHLDFESD